MMEIMITGRNRLLKAGGGTRSDNIGSESKTGAKADVGHLMKLATSNPALSEPFRDTDDYVAVAANSERLDLICGIIWGPVAPKLAR